MYNSKDEIKEQLEIVQLGGLVNYIIDLVNEEIEHAEANYKSDKARELKDAESEAYDRGFDDGAEDADPSEGLILNAMLEKFKDAEIRGIDFEQLKREIESEAATYMPTLGLKLSKQERLSI